tara:strand:+ start:1584 stop:1922 length:339 start_codon:yes stop_codon:yes gene_type:complete
LTPPPAQLGDKIDGRREGTCPAGAIVMDQARRDGEVVAARLRVGPHECDLMLAWDDKEAINDLSRPLPPLKWHGFIRMGDGREWRVSIDPETWVMTWHEPLVQRVPYREPEA